MIVVTVYFSILNQMELHLVQNRKENCQHDHIPFNVKGNGNIVFSVKPSERRVPFGSMRAKLEALKHSSKTSRYGTDWLKEAHNRYPFMPVSVGKMFHRGNSQRNLFEILLPITSNQNQIVFTMHRLIWNSKRTHCSFAVPNQSVHSKYNLISV